LCQNNCTTTCWALCANNCQNTCSGTCTSYCDNACTSTEVVNIINALGNLAVDNIIFSEDFLNINTVLYADLTRRNISGGVDISSDLAAGNVIRKASIQQIYDNAKLDGYSAAETFEVVLAEQLNRIATYVQGKALENIRK
jgi:hypothetical protein